MATFHFRTYHYEASGIPPRGASNWVWGPDARFSGATVTISGEPKPEFRHTVYALFVQDSSISNVNIGHGDIDNYHTRFHATFFNSGNPGDGTIKSWTSYIAVEKFGG